MGFAGSSGRGGFIEDRDPFKVKDKNNRIALCFRCGEAASLARNRTIIACDACDKHWHLDCLNPPLVSLPPSSRRWTCPAHAESVSYELDPCNSIGFLLIPTGQASRRVPRNQDVVVVTEEMTANNGDIEVLPKPRSPLSEVDYDELYMNGLRYQVPEDILVLDFWGRLQGRRSVDYYPTRPADQTNPP
jgi:PHD-finger